MGYESLPDKEYLYFGDGKRTLLSNMHSIYLNRGKFYVIESNLGVTTILSKEEMVNLYNYLKGQI